MSLINFLNPKLKPLVECDCVCEDGHEVSNLIADDAEQLHPRGFMAFAVSKPPIEIVFEFPKAIDLKVIKLWNSLGALRSTWFEIYGKYDGIWERVGFVRDLSSVDSVTFCYQSDYSSRSNADCKLQQQSEKVFFFKTAHKILAHTTCLKLVIRATQKCAPVLKKIQIWGLPARSLEKADRELVRTIWNEITFDQRGTMAAQQQQEGQRSPCRPELHDATNLIIPEDFLDQITWEVMIFPTVLPSGKIVDQSTIDRHSEVEAKWGRLPSDPFTGLEFTHYRKAVLDLPLKARIEKFLMENSEHFKTIPRCLGSSRLRRSRNRHASQFASLHTPSMSSRGTYSSLVPPSFKSSKKTATATLSSTMSSPAKRVRLSETTTAAAAAAAAAAGSTLCTYRSELVGGSLTTSTTTITTATQTSATATLSSSTSVAAACAGAPSNSSIDEAIQLALSKITRFTQPAPPIAETTASCIKCHTPEFSYEIQTCRHLVCRACLSQMSKVQMCECNTSFSGSDVQRYHRL